MVVASKGGQLASSSTLDGALEWLISDEPAPSGLVATDAAGVRSRAHGDMRVRHFDGSEKVEGLACSVVTCTVCAFVRANLRERG